MRVSQADIVEVVFPLPNGQQKPHPALVISHKSVFEAEEFYIVVMLSTKQYNEEFIYEINSKMLTYASDKVSFAKLHLIERFEPTEIISRFGSIKPEYFKELIKQLNSTVFGIDF